MSQDTTTLATSIESGFGRGYSWLDRTFIPAAKRLPSWITANRITYFRVVMAIPIGLASIRYSENLLYMSLILLAYTANSFLDYVDGLVARAKGTAGDYGAYVDAVGDKVYFLLLLSLICTKQIEIKPPPLLVSAEVMVCTALFLLEMALLVIRVEDYQSNKEAVALESGKQLDLKAKLSGKIKMVAELILVGGILYADQSVGTWPLSVATVAGAIAIPFGIRSLLQKLDARKALDN